MTPQEKFGNMTWAEIESVAGKKLPRKITTYQCPHNPQVMRKSRCVCNTACLECKGGAK